MQSHETARFAAMMTKSADLKRRIAERFGVRESHDIPRVGMGGQRGFHGLGARRLEPSSPPSPSTTLPSCGSKASAPPLVEGGEVLGDVCVHRSSRHTQVSPPAKASVAVPSASVKVVISTPEPGPVSV